MGKSINFTGQPVLSQLLKFIDKQKNLDLSRKMGCERYVKSLDGCTHFVVMLFDVLKHFDSLRELEIEMLAEANKRRSQEFFANVYLCCWNNMGLF